ncbi:MAG: PAS domain-containing sensor histidine kinase [Polyangiaceae bacterium]
MSDPKPSRRTRRPRAWGRPALAAGSLLAILALLVTLIMSYRNVERAGIALARGEAAAWFDRVRRTRPDERGAPPDLERFLKRHETAGLRYVALGTPEGIQHSAGEPKLGPVNARDFLKGSLTIQDNRVRAVSLPVPPPPRCPPEAPDCDPEDLPPPHLPPGILLEFETRSVPELREGALQSLGVGLAAALALGALTILLWRAFSSHERLLIELARERRLASLGQMSAVLAHEIKNPLASLKGNAQLLAEVLPTASKAHARSERVVKEAIRLERLVLDLLAFARSGELAVTDVDLQPLLASAIQQAQAHVWTPSAERDISESQQTGRWVVVDAVDLPATWPLDAERIRQVLVNLLQNGLHASPEPVTLEARVRNNELILRVVDSGRGFEGDPEALFEPFHTTRTQGTGLGLAIARRMVELHGGSITASNLLDETTGVRGACFEVRLPRGVG